MQGQATWPGSAVCAEPRPNGVAGGRGGVRWGQWPGRHRLWQQERPKGFGPDMSKLKVGDWYFDSAEYDAERDVLYLSMGAPRPGYGEETPEGHILRFDEEGEFCGVTLIGVREKLDKGTP